jgi:hypothetical protein
MSVNTVVILFLIIILSIIGANISNSTLVCLKSKFLTNIKKLTDTNIIYILTILFLIFLNTKTSYICAAILLASMGYLQPNLWLVIMNSKLIQTPMSVRKELLIRLFLEHFVLIKFTLHKDIYNIFKSDFEVFRDLLKSIIEDIKVALNITIDPTSKLTDAQKALFN